MCIHPELRTYISECVSSIRPVLEKGEVEKVVVVVLSSKGVPVEKFVFEIVQRPIKPHDIRYSRASVGVSHYVCVMNILSPLSVLPLLPLPSLSLYIKYLLYFPSRLKYSILKPKLK